MTVGCGIQSALEGTTCGTGPGSCATSYATPHAAAAATLIRQYFTEGRYPTGTPQPSQAFAPSAALLKAMLVNCTVDMTQVSDYPNNTEGWGVVQLDRVLNFADSPRQLLVADIRHADGLQTGETQTYGISVINDIEPLAVTLAWTDPPAAAGSTSPAVNDLDLIVTSPDGAQTFLGNVFTGGFSTTGGAADTLNNVERVLVNRPMLGDWQVTVRATAVNVGNPGQGYALAITYDAVDIQLLQACASTLLLRGDRETLQSPAVPALSHYAGAVQPGVTTYGSIKLPAPAPAEGKIVRFTTSDPAVARVPNVVVPAGSATAAFALTIAETAADATATLTATADITLTTTISVPTRRTRTLELGTTPGYHANVPGLACLDHFVYATHFHSLIGNGHESLGPGLLAVLDGAT